MATHIRMRPPPGLIALSSFFWFGATMAGIASLALLFPANEWELIWRLNPEAHSAFLAMGSPAILLMLSVSAACAFAAIGLWMQARWGQRLAIVVLLANMAGDIGNAAVRGDRRTLIGIPIAAAMIAYLVTLERKKTIVAGKDAH